MQGKHRYLYLIGLLILIAILAAGCKSVEQTTEPDAPPADVADTPVPDEPPVEEPTAVEPDPEPEENVIVFIQRNDFPNLDPSASSSGDVRVLTNVYETLTFFNPPGSAEILSPRLATAWESNDDGTEWTFTIRQGVKFHDGTDLNAEAVMYSIERTIELGLGASYIWAAVDEISVADEYTVIFKLSYAAPLDIVASSAYAAWIFSPAAAEANDTDWFQENDAGSGPYKIESREVGTRVTLTRFDDYWGGWEPGQFTHAVIEVVDDTVVRQQMIEAGDADITYGLSRESIPALEANPDVTVYSTPSYENMMAWFNTVKPPLDNALVRQALSYTIPYQDIVQGVILGGGVQAHGPVPTGVWGHSDDILQYSYDLDKAQELLDEAGFGEGGFDLVYTHVAGDFDQQQVGELWKAELAKLNINLEIQSMTWTAQWDLAKADPAAAQDIFTMYWYPDIVTPYSFLFLTFHCEDEPFFNVAYYCNPEFDTLIDDADVLSATDRAESISKYIEAQQLLAEDAAAAFFYDINGIHILRSDISGYVDNPAYSHVFFFYDLSR